MRNPRSLLVLASVLTLLACAAPQSSQTASEAPPTVGAQPSASGGEATGGEPSAEPAGGARLAFIACEGERPSMCTEQYQPVCGEVDNGVRCVTTPCPSTDPREFPNACFACAEPKTTGYWPVPCAQLGDDAR